MIAGAVVELHNQRIALGCTVDVLLHNAAVADHGFRRHPFLAAGNAVFHVVHVVCQQAGGTLCFIHARIQSLTEATLSQLVEGQQTRRGDIGGLIGMHLIAPATNGNVARFLIHECRQLTVAATVLGQNFVRLEDVTCPGVEIAILEKADLRDNFLGNCLKDNIIKEVNQNCH